MNRLLNASVGLGLFALAPHGAAQLVAGATQNDNVVFRHGSFPTSNASSLGSQELRVTGATGQNHLVQTWWYWRRDGDTRELAFHDGAAQGARAASYSGDTATLSWSNVDNRGLSAVMTVTAYSTGLTAGGVIQHMLVTNNTGGPITLTLFAYADLDQCGASSHTASANPSGLKQRINPPAGCTVVGETYAPGADRFQVAAFPVVRDLLLDGALTQLNNTGLPFGPGNYTAAWQWQDRVIPANQSMVSRLLIAQDHVHTGCTGTITRTYGVAKPGTNGNAVFHPGAAGALPFLGARANIAIQSGLAGALPLGVLGFGRASLNVGVGTLWVNPAGLSIVLLNPFDAGNASATRFQVPNEFNLCGLRVNWQAFFLDTGAADGIAHTDGLEWFLGVIF